MAEWICSKCGYIYNESLGNDTQNVQADTPFEKIDPSWVCPRCGVGKAFFVKKA